MDNDDSDRILTPAASDDEKGLEPSLRPRRFDEFVGQQKVVTNLRVYIQAALERNESLDHVLLFGPPGLGKTTLAHVIGEEMGVGVKTTAGPALEKAGDLAAILTNLQEGEILFIDEVHRLGPTVEEILYPAVEDFKLDLVIGQGPAARMMEIPLPRFTLIAATTRAGLITKPLYGRFGIVHRLDFYAPEELTRIIDRSGHLLEIEIDQQGATEIARRSRGTPRVSNRLLRRVRDFAQVEGRGTIDLDMARRGLAMLEVDERGFEDIDRRILSTLIERYAGGPAGIQALAASVGEDRGTLEDVYEPFLIQEGFIQRTPRGRVATREAYLHLGYDRPKGGSSGLLF